MRRMTGRLRRLTAARCSPGEPGLPPVVPLLEVRARRYLSVMPAPAGTLRLPHQQQRRRHFHDGGVTVGARLGRAIR